MSYLRCSYLLSLYLLALYIKTAESLSSSIPQKLVKSPIFGKLSPLPPPPSTRDTQLSLLLPNLRKIPNASTLSTKKLISKAVTTPSQGNKWAVAVITTALLAFTPMLTSSLPPTTPFPLAYSLTFLPFLPVFLFLTKPSLLPTLISSLQYKYLPPVRTSVAVHEAGHILMAHLLGYEVRSVMFESNPITGEGFGTLAAVEFKDPKSSPSEVASKLGFDKPLDESGYTYTGPTTNAEDTVSPAPPGGKQYFGDGGSGEYIKSTQSVFRNSTLSSRLPKTPNPPTPSSTWPYRGYTLQEVQALSTISMAGMAAELTYTLGSEEGGKGNKFVPTQGGSFDLLQMELIFEQSQDPLSKEEKERITSQALTTSITMLKYYGGAFVDLVEGLLGGVSDSEGIYQAIEGCGDINAEEEGTLERISRLSNKGNSQTLGVFNINDLPITGDDPLYIAIAVAGGFFVWASTGGMSLH